MSNGNMGGCCPVHRRLYPCPVCTSAPVIVESPVTLGVSESWLLDQICEAVGATRATVLEKVRAYKAEALATRAPIGSSDPGGHDADDVLGADDFGAPNADGSSPPCPQCGWLYALPDRCSGCGWRRTPTSRTGNDG